MYLTVILTFILDLLKIFFVNGFDEEMKEGGDTDEAGHGVHGVVVEKWTEMKIRIKRFYFVNPGNYLGSIVP